jgi:hypothetical protein
LLLLSVVFELLPLLLLWSLASKKKFRMGLNEA